MRTNTELVQENKELTMMAAGLYRVNQSLMCQLREANEKLDKIMKGVKDVS